MMSSSSFVAIFVIFLQIFVPSKAASISSSRNSGVIWETEELPNVENTPGQDSDPVDASVKPLPSRLLDILEEMNDYIDLTPADEPNDEGDQQIIAAPPCSKDAEGNPKQRETLKREYQKYYEKQLLKFFNLTQYSIPMRWIKNVTTSTPPTIPSEQQDEPLDQIMKKAEERRSLPEFAGRQKMVSQYPDCDNSNIWGRGNTIDFSFDLSFLKPLPDMVINVTSAFVRMHKKPLNLTATDSIQIPPNRNISFLAVYYKNLLNKKDQSKKGIRLAEQILRADEERWTEWDVRKAIAAGFNNTSRYNRVTIKVADDQIHLPAREFFTMPMNCSHITVWPSLTVADSRESTHQGMRKDLPFIDMIIREIPIRDVQYAEKEQEFLNGVKVMKQQADKGNETIDGSAEPKIRHKKNKETDAKV